VTAIARHDRIAAVSRRQGADDGSLGAIAKVRVPANDTRMLDKRALHSFLEFANAQHLRPDPDQPVVSKVFGWIHGRLSSTSG
jgi:hypothetical protein